MALKANYEFLFVGKDDTSFLENYYYDLFQDYGEKSGQIFVTLEVANNPLDAEEIGKRIFEAMQTVFFEDIDREPYERFEVALKEVNKMLKEFKSTKKSGYIGNLSVIIAAIVGKSLYLTQCGEAEAYMVRKRYVSVISEGLGEEGGEDLDVFSNIASGQIEEGDFVLFSSTRLLRYISKNDLAKLLSQKTVPEALENVKDAISTEMLGRVGLTGIHFSAATKEDVEEVKEGVDNVTRSILEASEEQVSAQKESITGRFLTALRNRKKSKTEIFQGESSSKLSGIKSSFGGVFKNLFSGGFGKDKILVLLVTVIVVLGAGIWIVKGNTAQQAELDRLNKILVGVQDKISEAETKSAYDKEAAKTVLDRAYAEAIEVLNSGLYRQKAQTYLVQIDQTRDKLDNVTRIATPTVVADLATKRPDVNALGFVQLKDRVFVYEYNALYELVLDQIQDPLTIDENEVVISATGFDDQNSIVFLTKSGKLIEYKGGTMSFMDTEEGAFRKAVSIEDWSNKIYLLDDVDGQIYRYTYKGVQGKFGPSETYLADQTDLTGAIDLAIDASVYVLKRTGDIFKLYGGKNASLVIENKPFSSLKDPTDIYTNEKVSEVYVVDSKQSRVVVYQKDQKSGNLIYKSQYLFEDAGEIRDVYVDASAKKLFVLTSSKVLEVAL